MPISPRISRWSCPSIMGLGKRARSVVNVLVECHKVKKESTFE